jgi:hypothetical protein
MCWEWFVLVMAPKKEEYSNDLRTLVIKHFQNGDSQWETAAKTLLPRETVRYILNEYKRTKYIGTLFDRGRKRITTATSYRLIQRMLKEEQRILAVKVRTEVEQLLGISLITRTIRNRAHDIGLYGRLLERSRMWTRWTGVNVCSTLQICYRNRSISGKPSSGPTSQNSPFFSRTEGSWCGGTRRKPSIPNVLLQPRGKKQTPDKIVAYLRTPMRKETLVKFCDNSVSAIETSD